MVVLHTDSNRFFEEWAPVEGVTSIRGRRIDINLPLIWKKSGGKQDEAIKRVCRIITHESLHAACGCWVPEDAIRQLEAGMYG